MEAAKRKRLEAIGWSVSSVTALPKLSSQETAFAELKLSLSENLKRRRQSKNLSQMAIAKKIKLSQNSL